MKCGILFSGGKDSTYAAFLTKKYGYEITSLITIISENPDSYMFHTPSISKVKKQSVLMNIPLITQNTTGIKEKELKDLEKVIQKSIKQFNIDSIVTGTVESAYQSSRIQKICDKLGLDCFNPLWQKNQIDLLYELVENKFITIIVGVFAYPFDKKWLGKNIDNKFIEEIAQYIEKYKINPAGEGGEFETFVLNCPLFSRSLKIKEKKIFGNKNSWKLEIDVE